MGNGNFVHICVHLYYVSCLCGGGVPVSRPDVPGKKVRLRCQFSIYRKSRAMTIYVPWVLPNEASKSGCAVSSPFTVRVGLGRCMYLGFCPMRQECAAALSILH
jgi:hypothetical protein